MSAEHHLQLVSDPRYPIGLDRVLERVDTVQVRRVGASAADLFAEALAVQRVARSSGARVLVHERADIALAVRAHGVHLPARGLPPAAARALLETWQLVGVSVHSVEEARAAERDGADYVTFGSVFASATHPELPPRGIAALAEVVANVDVPVLAIGGIDAARIPDVLATGCAGVAVISAILAAPDAASAAARLRVALDASPTEPKRAFPERRD